MQSGMTLVKRRSSIKFTTEGQLFHHLRKEMVSVGQYPYLEKEVGKASAWSRILHIQSGMTLVKRRSSIKFTSKGHIFYHLRKEMVLVAVSVFGKGSRKGFCVVEDAARPKRHRARDLDLHQNMVTLTAGQPEDVPSRRRKVEVGCRASKDCGRRSPAAAGLRAKTGRCGHNGEIPSVKFSKAAETSRFHAESVRPIRDADRNRSNRGIHLNSYPPFVCKRHPCTSFSVPRIQGSSMREGAP